MYWNGLFGKESVIRSPSSYAPQHIAATAAVAPRQVGSLVMCSIYLHKWSNQWIMSIWRYLIEGMGKTSWSTCYFTFRDLTVQYISTNFQYRWTSLLAILFCENRSLQLFDMNIRHLRMLVQNMVRYLTLSGGNDYTWGPPVCFSY